MAEDNNSLLSKQIQDYKSKNDDNIKIIHEKQKLVSIFLFYLKYECGMYNFIFTRLSRNKI